MYGSPYVCDRCVYLKRTQVVVLAIFLVLTPSTEYRVESELRSWDRRMCENVRTEMCGHASSVEATAGCLEPLAVRD